LIFDRSWYNRAGVEYVMGFCTEEQHRRFLELCPLFEKYIVEGGVMLFKFWFKVGNEDQERRFKARIENPRCDIEGRTIERIVAQFGCPGDLCNHPVRYQRMALPKAVRRL